MIVVISCCRRHDTLQTDRQLGDYSAIETVSKPIGQYLVNGTLGPSLLFAMMQSEVKKVQETGSFRYVSKE